MRPALLSLLCVAHVFLGACQRRSDPPADEPAQPLLPQATQTTQTTQTTVEGKPANPNGAPSPQPPRPATPAQVAQGALQRAAPQQLPTTGLPPLKCFGTEPYWLLHWDETGQAHCSQTCDDPGGLQIVRYRPTGTNARFDVVTADGQPFLRAHIKRTERCSDDMSDTSYPFEFTAKGMPGDLVGCCQTVDSVR